MSRINSLNRYIGLQLWVLVISRILIGWYFLYEGVSKILNPDWSANFFLLDSQGFFAPLFKSLAFHSELLRVTDSLIQWGLAAIGFGLIVGLFTRVAIVFGIIITALFSLSHPPLIGVEYALPTSDNAMWVGKNIIFIFFLILLYLFPTSDTIGIDRFYLRKKID